MSAEEHLRAAGIPQVGGGDVWGEPLRGHRIDTIHAAVLIQPDGSEGLMSSYTFDGDGQPTGRVTFVTSDPTVLKMMKRMLLEIRPPEGGRIEWREYRQCLTSPRPTRK